MKLTKSLLNEIDLKLHSTKALFALMLFNSSRFEERNRLNDQLNDLEMQNRNNWDQGLISLGIDYLNDSKPNENLNSRFHLEANIASIHCMAKTFENTDWSTILKFYDKLIKVNTSSYVQLNRCIAIFYANGAQKAIKEIEKLELDKTLSKYYLFNCTLGKIHNTLNNINKSTSYYKVAINQTKNGLEKKYIQKQIEKITC